MLLHALGWGHFVSVKIKLWEQFHLKWLEQGNSIMVVVFEGLTKDSSVVKTTLNEISTFLGFTPPNEQRIDCTIHHSEGRFHRKQKCIKKKIPVKMNEDTYQYEERYHYNLDDIFTKIQKSKINQAIENVNAAIMKRGLTPLPVNDYKNTVVRLNICWVLA